LFGEIGDMVNMKRKQKLRSQRKRITVNNSSRKFGSREWRRSPLKKVTEITEISLVVSV
jgi:hypothetical protein